MMKKWRFLFMMLPLLLLFMGDAPAHASGILTQCPGDTDGDLIPEPPEDILCMHITGGDGFVKMADGNDQYIFSFGLAGKGPLGGDPPVPPAVPEDQVIAAMTLKQEFPAPTIILKEGQQLYLTLTNVGMIMRPDLFDTHTVHWHGFHNAAPVFDGLPEPSPAPVMGASFTYWYNAYVPGTYFYHCHVEVAEHLQMGMIGNVWVTPAQDDLPVGRPLANHPRSPTHRDGDTYVYNDGDGSTYYDVAYPVQLVGFDSNFHDANLAVQPLPFADMNDNYFMINGRGYPDTINPNNILNQEGFAAQKMDARIEATAGEIILLRISNVLTTHLMSIRTTLGVPMNVVGRGAALLRGPEFAGPGSGKDTSFEVDVLHIGGGQHMDVLIDTTGVAPGTYFLYTTDLAHLSNDTEERGGAMTEIVIN